MFFSHWNSIFGMRFGSFHLFPINIKKTFILFSPIISSRIKYISNNIIVFMFAKARTWILPFIFCWIFLFLLCGFFIFVSIQRSLSWTLFILFLFLLAKEILKNSLKTLMFSIRTTIIVVRFGKHNNIYWNYMNLQDAYDLKSV